MAGDIDVSELRSLSVSQDGTAFRIGLADRNRQEVGVVLPSEALKVLMLSLFRVGGTVFKTPAQGRQRPSRLPRRGVPARVRSWQRSSHADPAAGRWF